MGKHRKGDTAPDGSPMSEKVKLAAEFDQSVEDSKKAVEENPYPVVAEGSKITVAPVRKWAGQ